MNFSLLRVLPALLLSLFAFAGCSSLPGMPAGLSDALSSVTGLSDGVTNWKNSLGTMLGGTELGQLSQYVDQAGELGSKISGMTEGLSEAMADPLGMIGSKLKDMSGLDVEKLKGLAPERQMDAVNGFTDSAGEVGSLASDFMKKFGN